MNAVGHAAGAAGNGCLPRHGRVECAVCHAGQPYSFDRVRTESDGWRITNNPLAWGSQKPEVVVLGFSKGPTQAGALATQPHDSIAYRGGRPNLAKILHHVGLLPSADARHVDQAISDTKGRFHFASLVRCTIERFDEESREWAGTGGGMLDKFLAKDFGRSIVSKCASQFLGTLPPETRLVLMLGMGTAGRYVSSCRELFASVRPGAWRDVNEVTYTDDKVTVVHTEHFKSQGALLPNWLSGDQHPRGRLGDLSRAGVDFAFAE